MIKLVSPKYYGGRTPEPVKQKVIELLYFWTKQFPQVVCGVHAEEPGAPWSRSRSEEKKTGAGAAPKKWEPELQKNIRLLYQLLEDKHKEFVHFYSSLGKIVSFYGWNKTIILLVL